MCIQVPFLLTRYYLRDRAQAEIVKRPAWRAVDKVSVGVGLCSSNGSIV